MASQLFPPVFFWFRFKNTTDGGHIKLIKHNVHAGSTYFAYSYSTLLQMGSEYLYTL